MPRVSGVVVVIRDVLNILRTPSVTDLATGGVNLPGSKKKPPMVLVQHQDNSGQNVGDINGEVMLEEVFFSIFAVIRDSDLSLAEQIDNEVKKILLQTNKQVYRSNSSGLVYSCTFMNSRSFTKKAEDGEMLDWYLGGYYRFMVQGNEL